MSICFNTNMLLLNGQSTVCLYIKKVQKKTLTLICLQLKWLNCSAAGTHIHTYVCTSARQANISNTIIVLYGHMYVRASALPVWDYEGSHVAL